MRRLSTLLLWFFLLATNAVAGSVSLMGVGTPPSGGSPPADCVLSGVIANDQFVTLTDGLSYRAQNGNKAWSAIRWTCDDGIRFEVRSGDKPSFDASDVERSELSGQTTYPLTSGVSAEIWCAWSERLLNPPGLASSLFKTSPQAHHSGNTGNPPWSINYTQSNAYQVQHRYNASGGPNGTLVTNPVSAPSFNVWYDMVIQLKFNQPGTCNNCGINRMWRDGVNVVDPDPVAAINMGYQTQMSPVYMKLGIYRGSSSQVTIKDYANWECATGVNALQARILNPLPVTIP